MALKENLLQFLSERSGQLYSGEYLAETFRVTRAAVWKSMKQLIAEGYQIEAHGGQGYVFLESNDTLNKNMIIQSSGKSEIPIILLDTVDSTNLYARRLTQEGCETGTLIVANEQTAGRGRKGHSFYSPADTGIYTSYILKTHDKAENLLTLTLAAGVAVCEALEECTDNKPQIKWVNDIYCNQKKIAGILTESTFDFETQLVDFVIIGIGINVHTNHFPEDLKDLAGSIPGNSISRNQLIGVLYNKLEKWISCTDKDLLISEYRKRSLLIGKQISYMINGVSHSGLVTDINDSGNLIVQKNSREITLSSGEVHILSWE